MPSGQATAAKVSSMTYPCRTITHLHSDMYTIISEPHMGKRAHTLKQTYVYAWTHIKEYKCMSVFFKRLIWCPREKLHPCEQNRPWVNVAHSRLRPTSALWSLAYWYMCYTKDICAMNIITMWKHSYKWQKPHALDAKYPLYHTFNLQFCVINTKRQGEKCT